MKPKCIALFLLFFSTSSFAQHHIYNQFGIDDGLPSLEVHDMYQENNGLILFATDRGMASYNSYEIEKINIQDRISNVVILDLFPQSNGTTYAATFNNQLFYFNDTCHELQPYEFNHILKETLEFKQHISDVFVDAHENIHIACEHLVGTLVISKEGEILKKTSRAIQGDVDDVYINLEKKNDTTLFFSYSIDSLIKEKNTRKIALDLAVNNLAILLKESNYIVYSDRKTLKVLDNLGKLVNIIKTTNNPIDLKALSRNTFFVGYELGGGVIMNTDGTVIEHFLPNESVSDFLIDDEGGYWFSTLHSGVFYIKEPNIKILETDMESPAIALTKTTNDDLYASYRTGEVLRIAKNRSIVVESNGDSDIKSLIAFDAAKELLYVKSDTSFYTKNKLGEKVFFNDSIAGKYFLKISEPLDNKIIITTRIGFIVFEGLDTKEVRMPYRVQDVAFFDDTYYVGTPVGIYSVKKGEQKMLSDINPIFNYRADDIDVNTIRNELYLATLGSGVIIYNADKEVRTIKTAQGLSSNMVNELYVENKDELWVCTNSGLNKISFAEDGTFQISGFKSYSGLLNDGINDVEIINDTVWIASNSGLMYAPKKLFNEKTTSNAYHLRVKAVHVNDSLILQEKLQNLSHTENRIEFLVEGIYFKAPSELNYTYTMDGLDNKWYTTKNRRISYSALPYGSYTFKVAATTLRNGEVLTYTEIPIHIHAPFWKRPWFVISAILGVITLIYLFFKYRILSYNRHIISELLRLLLKKIKRKELYFSFKEAGKEIRIKTDTILYIKSAGNYVEVVTEQKNYTIRTKIGEFINLMPDPLEYLRIHRSYIVRMDKVAEKNSKEVTVGTQKLPVSNSYVAELNRLIF